MESLTLTTTKFRATVSALEPEPLTQRKLAVWMKRGLVAPSVHRGRKGSTHLWGHADIARTRLVMQLRRGGVAMPDVRAALTYLDKDLRRLLRPGSTASLIVDPERRRAHISRPGQPDLEVAPTPGQLRLRFDAMFDGIERAAKRAKKAAA